MTTPIYTLTTCTLSKGDLSYPLKNWQCFEIDSKDFERIMLCVGALRLGRFEVTGDIVELNASTRVACTSLGNYYELGGELGLTPEAQKKWQTICKNKPFTGVIDVTENIQKLMEMSRKARAS